MINMLPGEYAEVIRHGKHNETLIRWLLAELAAIVGLVVILGFGWLYLNHQTLILNSAINTGKQHLEEQNISKVRQDADQISNDIKTINQVLGLEIRFSDLMQEIGKAMPPGTVLGGLTLAKVDGSIDLSASAKDYTSAAQIALNLSDPKNKIFSRADIVNVNCTALDTAYKCNVVLKALFDKTSQNRFLNIAAGESPK